MPGQEQGASGREQLPGLASWPPCRAAVPLPRRYRTWSKCPAGIPGRRATVLRTPAGPAAREGRQQAADLAGRGSPTVSQGHGRRHGADNPNCGRSTSARTGARIAPTAAGPPSRSRSRSSGFAPGASARRCSAGSSASGHSGLPVTRGGPGRPASRKRQCPAPGSSSRTRSPMAMRWMVSTRLPDGGEHPLHLVVAAFLDGHLAGRSSRSCTCGRQGDVRPRRAVRRRRSIRATCPAAMGCRVSTR